MRDSHRRAVGPWVLAGGLLGAAALLRVLLVPVDEGEAAVAAPGTERAASAMPAEGAAAPRLPAADAEPVSPALGAPATPVEPAPVARRFAYTGLIVDGDARPLPGALVWLVPDAATLRAAGHPLAELSGSHGGPPMPVLLDALSPSKFPSTESGEDGRFRIEAELVLTATPDEPVGERAFPELFAKHAGKRPTLHVCRETIGAADATAADGTTIDVGVLTLLPGVTVQGRVVDERMAPFPGVEAGAASAPSHREGDGPQSWFADFGRNFAVTVSGSDGRFRLDGLAPSSDAPLRLELDTPGFDGVRREVFAVAGETVELGDVRIDRGLSITGRVVDERGRPLQGTPVRLTDEFLEWKVEAHTIDIELLMIQHDDGVVGVGGDRDARFAETTSGPDGRFVIGGLDARTEYRAYAWIAGREPACAARLAAGGPEVELRLVPRGSLELVLVDARTAVPVRDATVRVFRRMIDTFANPPDALEMPVRRDADDASRFIVDEVCPSEIGVLVDSPGHGRHGLIAAGLPLGSAPAVRELRIVRGATLGGVVVRTDTGAPIGGATVELTADDRAGGELLEPRRLRTGDGGAFRLEGVAPGTCRLRASADGALPAFETVVVKAGEERLDLTLELATAGRFEGTVSVAGRGPVSGALVMVKESDGSWRSEGTARTGEDGRYAVPVSPGRWLLEFSGGASQRVPILAGASVAAAAVIKEASVAAGETAVVDAVLPAPARLSGRAVSAGEPVAEARIVARGRGVELSLSADAEGRFEREVAGCGELVLVARSPRGGISEATRVLVEPGGEAWAEMRFGGRTLSGQVREAGTGRSIPLARVLVSASGPREERPPDADPLVTDANGRFVIADMGVGEYRVQASHGDYAGPASQPLTIGPADRAPSVTLELARANRLTGFVRDAEGRGVPTRLVVTAWRVLDSNQQFSAVTAEDGSYKLTGLPDGWYTVTLTPPGFDSHGFGELDDYRRVARGRGEVEIEDGGDAQLDITLRAPEESR